MPIRHSCIGVGCSGRLYCSRRRRRERASTNWWRTAPGRSRRRRAIQTVTTQLVVQSPWPPPRMRPPQLTDHRFYFCGRWPRMRNASDPPAGPTHRPHTAAGRAPSAVTPVPLGHRHRSPRTSKHRVVTPLHDVWTPRARPGPSMRPCAQQEPGTPDCQASCEADSEKDTRKVTRKHGLSHRTQTLQVRMHHFEVLLSSARAVMPS